MNPVVELFTYGTDSLSECSCCCYFILFGISQWSLSPDCNIKIIIFRSNLDTEFFSCLCFKICVSNISCPHHYTIHPVYL